MKDIPPSRAPRLICSVLAAAALTGCQRYRSEPLDLGAHRAAQVARAHDQETITRFLERLNEHHAQTPSRFDTTDGISRQEGEVLALYYNADLRLARLDAGLALATAENAGRWQDPVFGFDGAELLSPSGPFEYGLTLGLTIPISGRLGLEQARADAAYEAELRKIVNAEWDTRAAVRKAWVEWSAAEEHNRLIQDTLARIEEIESMMTRLEGVEEITRVEARLVRAEVARFRSHAIEDDLRRRSLRSKLLALMGLPWDADVKLTPDLGEFFQSADDKTIDRLIEHNTQLDVMRAEYRVAEDALRLEIRKQYPDLEIGAGYGSEGNDDRLLLGASIAIPILNANRAGIAEAKATRERARAKAETTLERLIAQHARARSQLLAAQEQLAIYENQLVPMLDEQYREVAELLELGEVDVLLLLETLTRQQESIASLLALRVEQAEAAIEIERLLGPDQPQLPAPIAGDTHTDTTTSKTDSTQPKGGDQ